MNSNNKIIASKVYSKIKKKRPKIVFDKIISDGNRKTIKDWLDIGCATGDLIHFAAKKFDNTNFIGIDISKTNIALAKKSFPVNQFPNIEFRHRSLENFKTKKYFDCITACAVIGYYEDFNKFFNPLKKLLKSKGTIYIHGLFNPYNLFVKTEYKYKNNTYGGLNQFPLKDTIKLIESKNFTVSKYKINITKKILPNKEFPHRSFSSNHKIYPLMNGCLNLLPDTLLKCKNNA